MKVRIYFLDVDDTLVPHGSDVVPQESIDKINSIYTDGGLVYLFTARSKGNWIDRFRNQGLKFEDIIYKPVADEYVVVDDRLVFSAKSLRDLRNDYD